MDFDSSEVWRFIWLIATLGFALGELAVAGSFFLAPFAVGAAAAAAASFLGLSVGVSWAVFVAISFISFAAFRPLARRLDLRAPQSSVGSGRWVNREAVVIREIGRGTSGAVRLDREEWTADSFTGDRIPMGSRVLVNRVEGTRLVVMPLEYPELDPGSDEPKDIGGGA
ncbi:MAG TPA: NfeD family protein [Acidimicrobiales bacterium]|nr:NfeD family protein [Acidimicrobiales bacterium]